jgi:hypothetical protein
VNDLQAELEEWQVRALARARTRARVCVCVRVRVLVFVRVCVQVCACVHVHACVQEHASVFVCMCTCEPASKRESVCVCLCVGLLGFALTSGASGRVRTHPRDYAGVTHALAHVPAALSPRPPFNAHSQRHLPAPAPSEDRPDPR